MQLLLIEESNVHRVSDPAAGSGAMEDLTEKLCAAAWKQFQEIEALGGAFSALEKGSIQKQVATVRLARQNAVKDGKDPLIGATLFQNPDELPVSVMDVEPASVALPKPAVEVEPLPRIRLAEWFE